MTTLIESEPTTLYHCYAGKDRTGMISAFILGTVGVPDEIIVQDYAETTPHISHLVKEWRVDAVKNNRDMEKFERDVSSHAHTMVNFLAHVQNQYGGITAFLNTCGVKSADLDELKARLVG
jgi:protein-tyrosine phosphatase